MKPLVSVLMTVYNREKYIAQAIESVQASTYKNWELIIVDDVSKDNSLALSKSYAAKDIRIKVYQNETNLGDYPNRNKAASYAKGTYLKYVDADDMIYPHGIEQLVFYMEQFPSVGFGLCSLDQDLGAIFPFKLEPKEIYKRHYIEGVSVFHKAPLSSIIRKEVFDTVGGFLNVRHFGDFELWHRLSKRYSLLLMPHGIVWYRKTEGQEAAIRKENPLNYIKTEFAAIDNIQSKEFPCSSNIRKIILENIRNKIANAVVSSFKYYGIKSGIKMLKASGMSNFEIIRRRIRL